MLFIFLQLIISVMSDVRVYTNKGVIIGQKYNGYNGFFGVPYSSVNVHDPFGKSFDHPDFTKPFKATNKTIMCPQLIDSLYKGTLQCLTLNIYVPQKKHSRLPTLVWFYGESFDFGDANTYSSLHLVKHGIIFVSVNYRVGPFGFICTNEDAFPGNQALKDQLEALKWINRNIEDFGGDPNSITIAGSKHGGSFVDLHLYNDLNERLFDKAIIQSGSVFSYGFFRPPEPRYHISIANALDKPESEDIIQFLNRQNSSYIVDAAKKINRPLGVCREIPSERTKNFVTRVPYFLDLEDKVMKTKILIGHNSMEMLNLYASGSDFVNEGIINNIITEALENSFNFDKVKLNILTHVIKSFYFVANEFGSVSVQDLVIAMSDFFVVNGVERTINRLVTAGATVYKYVFSYAGATGFKDPYGAPQGEELKFLLDIPLSGPVQYSVRNTMVELWANFIKFGNPTPRDKPVAWTPLRGLSRQYLNIDSNFTMVDSGVQRRDAFWQLFWDGYQNYSVLI